MEFDFIGIICTLGFIALVAGIIQQVHEVIKISSDKRYKRYRAMQKEAEQKKETEPKQEATSTEKS